MAPEVFRHERYSLKCDVFSFSMIAFELFEGIIIDVRSLFRRAASCTLPLSYSFLSGRRCASLLRLCLAPAALLQLHRPRNPQQSLCNKSPYLPLALRMQSQDPSHSRHCDCSCFSPVGTVLVIVVRVVSVPSSAAGPAEAGGARRGPAAGAAAVRHAGGARPQADGGDERANCPLLVRALFLLPLVLLLWGCLAIRGAGRSIEGVCSSSSSRRAGEAQSRPTFGEVCSELDAVAAIPVRSRRRSPRPLCCCFYGFPPLLLHSADEMHSIKQQPPLHAVGFIPAVSVGPARCAPLECAFFQHCCLRRSSSPVQALNMLPRPLSWALAAATSSLQERERADKPKKQGKSKAISVGGVSTKGESPQAAEAATAGTGSGRAASGGGCVIQ